MKLLSKLMLLAVLIATTAQAEQTFKPFVLASTEPADFTETLDKTRSNLENAGFSILGEYSPFADHTLLIVTNDEALKVAAMSKRGAHCAIDVLDAAALLTQSAASAFANAPACPVIAADLMSMPRDATCVAPIRRWDSGCVELARSVRTHAGASVSM